MTRARGFPAVLLLVVAVAVSVRCDSRSTSTVAAAAALPERLTDGEFWALSQESSEPGGYFRSADITNLTSNEWRFQEVIPELIVRTTPGGVYLGVGPEQNYTYMVAIRPAMAVIFDVRRGNLDLQLMYKALFELSTDRAAFVSMLFSKPRPAGLSPDSSVDQIFGAFAQVNASAALYAENHAAIVKHLTQAHGLPLPSRDLEGIDEIYRTFYQQGFAIRSSPTYWDLMAATDERGAERSYLSSESHFQWLKQLQARNLVVPVVGDFGGPKAIRAIAHYLHERGATVAAFYLSNVEQYLLQDGKWRTFCRNVATLPLDASSTFIRSTSRGGWGGGGFVNSLGDMAGEAASCGREQNGR